MRPGDRVFLPLAVSPGLVTVIHSPGNFLPRYSFP
ncbi:5-oxoprolinase (ATP-hydrolyzing) [Arthrospira platensis C1]|nr:5-oxoprolinase (ATP-hydrolyzing) [Arthrospira platensis C1]